MAFNAKTYVPMLLGHDGVVIHLDNTTHESGISGCCGSNITQNKTPAWNKGINIGQGVAASDHTYDPLSDRSRYTEEYAKNHAWPKVEFYEADLSELVGQPCNYEVVIQKEFTHKYHSNLEMKYVKKDT